MPASEAMTMTASAITSTKKAQGGGRGVLVTIVGDSRVSKVGVFEGFCLPASDPPIFGA
jgi:hypothetical protein